MPAIPLSLPSSTPLDGDAEAALVQRARRGDHNAFARLYREHARTIHTLAWRITSDAAVAEDIVQETFLRMLRFIGGLRAGAPVRPWLKQVASRLAIDHLRRQRWHLQEVESTDEHHSSPDSGPDTLSEAVGLMQTLSPLARSLVWLNQMEGWSHQELGLRFGRSESWSKSIVSRALRRLREQMHDDAITNISTSARRHSTGTSP